MNEITNKMTKLLERLNGIKIKDRNNKYCLFYKDMMDSLDKVSDVIDDYLLDNKSDIQVNKEIQQHIAQTEYTKSVIDVFSPFILHYQILNDLNKL